MTFSLKLVLSAHTRSVFQATDQAVKKKNEEEALTAQRCKRNHVHTEKQKREAAQIGGLANASGQGSDWGHSGSAFVAASKRCARHCASSFGSRRIHFLKREEKETTPTSLLL